MRVLSHPRFASACALLALVVALGGTSYAAGALPRNSVGSAQLKTNAVTTSDVKNGAVTGAKVKNGSLTSADLAPGTLVTEPIVGELPSGKTLQGYAEILAEVPAADGLASVSVSFANPLPADIANPEVDIIASGGTVPSGCSGTQEDPGAAPGHLCVFVTEKANAATININASGGDGSASRFGFNFWERTTSGGLTYVKATWAVTAP